MYPSNIIHNCGQQQIILLILFIPGFTTNFNALFWGHELGQSVCSFTVEILCISPTIGVNSGVMEFHTQFTHCLA